MQVVGREGSVVVGAAWRKMFYDRRNSHRCDSKTQEVADMSKLGGEKKETCNI